MKSTKLWVVTSLIIMATLCLGGPAMAEKVLSIGIKSADMGILDPAKVTRTALQAAGSVAALMITTEVMVADAPEEGGAGSRKRSAAADFLPGVRRQGLVQLRCRSGKAI